MANRTRNTSELVHALAFLALPVMIMRQLSCVRTLAKLATDTHGHDSSFINS